MLQLKQSIPMEKSIDIFDIFKNYFRSEKPKMAVASVYSNSPGSHTQKLKSNYPHVEISPVLL